MIRKAKGDSASMAAATRKAKDDAAAIVAVILFLTYLLGLW